VGKAVYVAREAPGYRARAFSSILFDRVAGVSGLVLIATGALVMSLSRPWAGRTLAEIELFVGICGAVVVSFYAYLFLLGDHQDPLLRLFTVLEKRVPALGSLTRIWEGLRHYRTRRGPVALAVGISLLIHVLVISACLHFACAR